MPNDETQNISLQDSVEQYLPFILEIRKRALFVIAIFLVFLAIGFLYYDRVIVFLLDVFAIEGVNIVFTSPFQFLTLAITIGMMLGCFFMFPMMLYQVLAFVRPALRPKEYKIILSLIPASILLFITGFSFGLIMMRLVLVLFYQRTVELDIGNVLDISQLFTQILATSVLMGVAFQMPIVLTLLLRFKIIKYSFLAKKRPFAWAIALAFAALLPPTDLFSLVLLTLPIIGLYEATLIINKLFLKPSN